MYSLKNRIAVIDRYRSNLRLYENFASKIKYILLELLEDENIPFHQVTSRIKSIESLSEKIENPRYTDPLRQITDLIGIRVITFTETEVIKISNFIPQIFKIDQENSIDKSKVLGTDKVGYKSVHLIASINDERGSLPEYRKVRDFKFEIQVRTLLQHSWAEITHDINYKCPGELPSEMKRKIMLTAGILEKADQEFDSINKEINQLHQCREAAGQYHSHLHDPITVPSLEKFFKEKFNSKKIDNILPAFSGNAGTEGIGERKKSDMVLEELENYGIYTIRQLNDIIPHNLNSVLEEDKTIPMISFTGLARSVMIIHNWNWYFTKAWKKKWMFTSKSMVRLFQIYNIPTTRLPVNSRLFC